MAASAAPVTTPWAAAAGSGRGGRRSNGSWDPGVAAIPAATGERRYDPRSGGA
ncbi:hypothetical protein SSCG_01470 [Streptomyces clavuligerus]|nr:hypothetical protein SSCG_01470 [Streptomyces clavuligerus]